MKLLTLAQVAEQLALSVPMIRKLVASGQLPVVRIGRSVRVADVDVDAFVIAHRPVTPQLRVLPSPQISPDDEELDRIAKLHGL